MNISDVSENPAMSGADGGRGIANLVYILYIIGFFVGFTALVGVVLAYVNRSATQEIYQSHLSFQIKIFWRGVTLIIVSSVLYLLISAVGVATSGVGFVLFIVPVGLGIWWFVWTIMAIAKGMGALGRREPVSA